jgi:hypothetical protein
MMSLIECASWLKATTRICVLQLGALEGIHFVYSLDARGPTTLAEVTAIVALCFLSGRRGELRALTPTPTGIPFIVSGD